jgi:hypothetical protein
MLLRSVMIFPWSYTATKQEATMSAAKMQISRYSRNVWRAGLRGARRRSRLRLRLAACRP